MKRIVAALGGNALLRRGEALDMATQRRNARAAAVALAPLAQDSELIVTHGNGPQVGLLALQAAAYGETPTPLDILGAESEGMIGYILEQELRSVLPEREIASLLTLVEVDAEDPAFESPTKPIGPVYPRDEAERLAEAHGWSIAEDGDGCRRVVASPEPGRILAQPAIKGLAAAGTVTICAGGGGVPVARTYDGRLEGVEAVVDKDLAAALLARELDADLLLLLTDVDAVYLDWRGDNPRAIRAAPPAALRELSFAPGSMRPKVEAACRFAEQGRRRAAIGALGDAAALVEKRAGTQIHAGLKSLALR